MSGRPLVDPRALLALVAALAGGCGKKEPASPAAAPGRDGGVTPSSAQATAPSGTDVQPLIDRWLAAQNGGDFAAYSDLYAARFTGVRRSGAKTMDLDRDGWLRERKRMFRRPVVVSIEGLAWKPGTGGLDVDFVQSWSSGAYKDRGAKRMRLVMQDGAVRIAREEMLESVIDGAAGPVEAGDQGTGETSEDVGQVAGSFTGKGRSEEAVLRVFTGETTAPHGEESGEQGFVETERRAMLAVERDGREVASGQIDQWTDGWEWGAKWEVVGEFELGSTGVSAVVLRKVSSSEGGQSVALSVVRFDGGGDVKTLWEGSASDATASIGTDAIEITLVEGTGDEPFFGGSEQPTTEKSLRLVWSKDALVERPGE